MEAPAAGCIVPERVETSRSLPSRLTRSKRNGQRRASRLTSSGFNGRPSGMVPPSFRWMRGKIPCPCPYVIILTGHYTSTKKKREELESLARSRSSSRRTGVPRRDRASVRRWPGQQDGGRKGVHQPPDGRQVARALPNPRPHGLSDERRPGRPRSIEDDELMTLLQRTLETRQPDGATHWSLPFHGRRHGDLEVHGPPPLNGVQHPAPPARAFQALHCRAFWSATARSFRDGEGCWGDLQEGPAGDPEPGDARAADREPDRAR